MEMADPALLKSSYLKPRVNLAVCCYSPHLPLSNPPIDIAGSLHHTMTTGHWSSKGLTTKPLRLIVATDSLNNYHGINAGRTKMTVLISKETAEKVHHHTKWRLLALHVL